MSGFLGVLLAGGSGAAVPALSSRTFSGSPSASAAFRNDGTLVLTDSGGSALTANGEWLTSSPGTVSSAVCAAYDIEFTYVSGPNPRSGNTVVGGATKSGDAYATWLNLATTRGIYISAYTGTSGDTGGGTLVFDAAIRPAGGGATLATGRITLICSV